MRISITAVFVTAHAVAVCGRIIFVGHGCVSPEDVIDGMADQNARYWQSVSSSSMKASISSAAHRRVHKTKSKSKATKTSTQVKDQTEYTSDYSEMATCTEVVSVTCAPCVPLNECGQYNPCITYNPCSPCIPCVSYNPCHPCDPCVSYNPCHPCDPCLPCVTYSPCSPCAPCAPCAPYAPCVTCAPCILQTHVICCSTKSCKEPCNTDSVSVVITAAVALPTHASSPQCTTAYAQICGPYYCSASLDCCPQVCHPYYGYPQGGCNYPQPYCHGNGAGCNNNNNYGGYTGNQYQGCSWNQGYEAHPAYGYEGNHCSSQYYQPGPVQSVYDPHTAYCNNGAYPAYQGPYYSNAPYSAPYASEAYSAAYTNAPYSAAYTNAPYSTGYTNVPYSTAYTNAPYSSAYTTAPYSAAYTSAPYSTVYGSSYETVYQTPAPAPAPAPAPTVSYQTGCTCPTYKDSALACGSSVDDGSSTAYDASQAYEDIASDTQQQYSTDEYSSSTELAYSDNAKERKK